MVNKPGSNHTPLKKKKILLVLYGGDPCCDRLDLGFDDLNPAGRVNGLDRFEEIPGDLTRCNPVDKGGQVPCRCLGSDRISDRLF